jgi:penicillin-binding protein 1A
LKQKHVFLNLVERGKLNNSESTRKALFLQINIQILKTTLHTVLTFLQQTFSQTRSLVKRFPIFSLLACLPLFLIMSWDLFYWSVRWEWWGPLPSEQELTEIENPIASEVYTVDGVLLGKYFIENRTNVSYQAISPRLIDALTAIEDIRYFSHDGVDVWSLARVVGKTLLLQKEGAGGGSTLTQQLAKNLYPREDFGKLSLPVNKVREMVIARELEKIYSKEELLALYLNTVSFGANAYGIEEAAHRFFNTTAAELKHEEAAVLAAMLKAPTTYNPQRNPAKSRERRNLVFSQMEKYGMLRADEADSLQALPLKLQYTYQTHNHGLAPYFRERLRQELVQWCKTERKADGSFYNLYTDGLKIFTTLHSGMQKHAEESVAEHMPRLQKAFDREWPAWRRKVAARDLLPQLVKQSPRYRKLVRQGLTETAIDSVFRVPKTMKLFAWDSLQVVQMSPLDSILYHAYLLHTGMMAMEPTTGHVRAWVGGIAHRHFQFDHVSSRRQAGSVFKPLVYATALEAGIGPCEYFSNEQTTYEAYDDWTPRNADNEYGGEYSMQGGLTYSVNVASVNLIMKTGPKKVVNLSEKLGVEGELPPFPSLALGTGDVSVFEMVQVYGSFANGGKRVYPTYLLRIEDAQGRIVTENSGQGYGPQVMNPKNAIMIREMLRSVTDHGTAASLQRRYKLGKHFIGKTGTSQSQADGWFLGGNPGLVAGVWVGADNPQVHFRSLAQGQGAATALPIFARFFRKLYQDPEFAHLQKMKFPPPTQELREAMDCDEFWFPLSMTEFKEWWEAQNAETANDSLLNDSP